MTIQLKEKLNDLIKEKNPTKEELKELLTLIIKSGDPWEEAMGLLKNKKTNVLKYQKKMRRELKR